MKPRLLDLFCGAGGAARGYANAGFEVVGVDIADQPNYPFEFYREDALEALREGPEAFDAIHASPPCQAYSTLAARHPENEYPAHIEAARDLLQATGLPYVIENVEGAPLHNPTMLCGSSLGLDVRRHRLFETNFPLMAPGCSHGGKPKRFRIYEHGAWRLSPFVAVYGHGGGKEREAGPAAMGIDWMTRAELVEAIPPAYTEHIGGYLLTHLQAVAA